MPPESGELLRNVYSRLLHAYGQQHWWPADSPFEVMVGAILTQSTAWTNVAKAITNLKTADALSPPALRDLSLDNVAALIRPSGYYHSKAHKLKALVAWVGRRHDDLKEVFAGHTGDLRNELLSLHGIGEETADSILLYAGEEPVFVIDAYTRRITDRLGIGPLHGTYAAYQHLFVDNLAHETTVFNEYHALLVEHGKRTCRKAPLCDRCCLLNLCAFGRHAMGESGHEGTAAQSSSPQQRLRDGTNRKAKKAC
jgi:endonuclease-3 related protein